MDATTLRKRNTLVPYFVRIPLVFGKTTQKICFLTGKTGGEQAEEG